MYEESIRGTFPEIFGDIRARWRMPVSKSRAGGGFVEDDWLEKTLIVGYQVELDEFQPTLWCVTSTLAQEDLPRDLSILRTAAQHHKGCLGVYASVRKAGSCASTT
jgi:hypothetical protein